MQIVDVDDKLAIHAEVWLASDGGFQRELDEKRIGKMNASLVAGSICPPIVLAKIDHKLVIIDGQHRLAAWKRSPFPLKAMVVNLKDKKEAGKAFVTINTTQKRVRRQIVLMSSDDPWSAEVRRLSKKFDVTLMQADAALNGAQGGRAVNLGNMSPLDKQRTALVELVLATWTRDKRWEDHEGSFARPGTLKLASRMIRDMRSEQAIVAFLKNVLALDWGRTSALTHICGGSNSSQREMLKVINKELDERIK